ncbi:unnamed protein product [Paramecium pentaurelia]|uniref:Uncharacterized protein n=1 Tax=Paramecium pentaurelia TaxID=43138 RepID=A0A8S1VFI9_9CILI|nr:unnamed protein product [Paramecium pentaurelia]
MNIYPHKTSDSQVINANDYIPIMSHLYYYVIKGFKDRNLTIEVELYIRSYQIYFEVFRQQLIDNTLNIYSYRNIQVYFKQLSNMTSKEEADFFFEIMCCTSFFFKIKLNQPQKTSCNFQFNIK